MNVSFLTQPHAGRLHADGAYLRPSDSIHTDVHLTTSGNDNFLSNFRWQSQPPKRSQKSCRVDFLCCISIQIQLPNSPNLAKKKLSHGRTKGSKMCEGHGSMVI